MMKRLSNSRKFADSVALGIGVEFRGGSGSDRCSRGGTEFERSGKRFASSVDWFRRSNEVRDLSSNPVLRVQV